uniref:Gypsy retrotransposon integrase-like protein 1 n=1 Tax=Cyprinus carpio TaxID=7962 RepID=A0A8C1XQM0_CYPCA
MSVQGDLAEQNECPLQEQVVLIGDIPEYEVTEHVVRDRHASCTTCTEKSEARLKELNSALLKTNEIRKSSHDKHLTPKMQELKAQELVQRERKFKSAYENWKIHVRDVRLKLKHECSESDLCDMMDGVEKKESELKDLYDNMRLQAVPSQEIRRKELQRFLGFSNFYRRFIQNYSSITSPSLLRNKLKSLSWTPSATEAFATLKEAFTTAPLLVHPDPDRPFIVEVDASTTGVGAALSQQQGNPSRLHPCAFFSRKLNPAEVNYDIGNRELLAIKLVLEEWRHWLEGARHPFQVLTDHKNLEYLRMDKRLNPRQACWALFFTCFNFTISYRPGSKNIKADALSRCYTPEENSEEPHSILPERLIVSLITWSTETIPSSNASANTPPGCPSGMQYISRTRRTPLIHSAHTSLGTGQPEVNETLSLLKERFWWPNMASDVRRYVQGCKECAISKSPRHLPSGKLLPLPVPNRPWSHLGVDFITDLPISRNCTCIFVVVDRFSKSCCLIPLKGLPTAMETAELMFNHIFRYFGIPKDILSDRGPQFISRVWKAFHSLLGVAVSLSSGYHPQSNGQTERKIQEIGCFLRTFCHGHQNSWNQFLGWAEYAQNSLCQPSTGLTPFQCILSYQPPLFPWSGEPLDVPSVDYWFRESERVWDSAHHQLQRALRRRRMTADLHRSEAPTYQ